MQLITYDVSTTYYFKETGQKVQAGQSVTLPRGAGERYKTSHPGLLKETRVMEVAHPDATRAEEPVATEATVTEAAPETPVDSPAPAEEPAKKKRGRK